MKIVADDKIPYLKGALEPYAEMQYIPGSEITHEDISDADALLIRTRTKCTHELLQNTKAAFIGTATIGFDHIDTALCESHGINWTNAPGCNADSVEQYVSAALLHWARTHEKKLNSLTIGIIGVGNVGSRVAKSCSLLGLKVLLNDPPRARLEGTKEFTELDDICARADIISFHVPLTPKGKDKTFHLVDERFIKMTKTGVLLINTCRGEVTSTSALLSAIHEGNIQAPIIDCWENEPIINLELLEKCFIVTPHIAGYSQDGKANGTQQIVRALSVHFDLPLSNWRPEGLPNPANPRIVIDPKDKSDQEILAEAILHTYPIWEDDHRLRKNPTKFEELRGNYPIRREYKAYTIQSDKQSILNKIGFKTLPDSESSLG
ncbi:MAG: 4-phosphoerythronate dehydrogenase PdxB [Bacteroidales bacterium]|nr:4-phosphoerythronate dehydrogenase PdxB [Bacteroidales bacterium]